LKSIELEDSFLNESYFKNLFYYNLWGLPCYCSLSPAVFLIYEFKNYIWDFKMVESAAKVVDFLLLKKSTPVSKFLELKSG